nr:hypothetical protein [Tanacetum cinerariifolium]
MRDAGSMSLEELVAWVEEEAGSPYLRTTPIKPRRKGIEFPCKNLFGKFLHCDSVADEVVLHDNWEYEGLSLDGYMDVRDLVHTVSWTKIMMLRNGIRKRVAGGANYERLGSLIGLNEHEGEGDDPQVKTQVLLTVGSSRALPMRALDELAVISDETKVPKYTSLDCLKESKQLKHNKLKAISDLIAQTEEAIRLKERHMDVMDLEINY